MWKHICCSDSAAQEKSYKSVRLFLCPERKQQVFCCNIFRKEEVMKMDTIVKTQELCKYYGEGKIR